MLQADCIVSGVPTPTVKWLFNGKPASEQGFFTKEYKLIGMGLTMKQEGIYRCEATNHYGTIFKEKFIKILSNNFCQDLLL